MIVLLCLAFFFISYFSCYYGQSFARTVVDLATSLPLFTFRHTYANKRFSLSVTADSKSSCGRQGETRREIASDTQYIYNGGKNTVDE